MDLKRLLFLMIVIVLVFGIAACTRSYKSSEPIETTETVEEVVGSEAEPPTGATEVMGQIFMLATQTAMAEQGIVREAPTVEPTKVVVEGEQGEQQVPDSQEPAAEGEIIVPENQIEVPEPTPGSPDTYVLKAGEFPYCIARRFNVNPNEMLRESGFSGNETLPAGTTLVMPKSDRTFPGSRKLRDHPVEYSVNEGDSIYTISCLFGDVAPEAIVFANELQEPYTLTTDQVLYIP